MPELFDSAIFVSLFATLFVVMDPVGSIPLFLALTSTFDEKQRNRAAMQATLTSILVIGIFAYFGSYILSLLDISAAAMKLSGGVLLFLVAMQLLIPSEQEPDPTASEGVNVALVPLGTPLLAGPGAIVAVMIAWDRSHGQLGGLVAIGVAIVLMHFIMWITMRFAGIFAKVLGEGGTLLLTKIAGLLLAAIATEMIMKAIFEYIQHMS
ncbi:MAG: MarC family protein [Actinomycetaceae bacterium]|nr:MarC family protein [Actinomycetaceae bacterium]